MKVKTRLQYLEDRWDDRAVQNFDEAECLRYRSNLLGSDLRITNFGGGNTSSKIQLPDPFTGAPTQVLAVKGSGGDLASPEGKGTDQEPWNEWPRSVAAHQPKGSPP